MPLHSKAHVHHALDDEVYASIDAITALPKYRFPHKPREAKVVESLVLDELTLDGSSKMNLATFCQTYIDDEVRRIMDQSSDKNMIDKDEYPHTAELESRCTHMIASLWNSPDNHDSIGTSTTGSSESCMLGGLAALWRWREKRRKEGKDTSKPNMVTGAVQICWVKFARYFDVELREIPMDKGRYMMSPETVLERCDENTIVVVPTLGLTFTLHYEPVSLIASALDDLQSRTGLDIPLHIDGASGGFIAPFIHPDMPAWDFRLPRVKSISASGHKYGLAPLGVGWVIWREKADLPDDLKFEVNYLGGSLPTFAFTFSRSGSQVVAQYYLFLRLGREGYAAIHGNSSKLGKYIADEIAKMGIFEVLYDGIGGIPGAAWSLKEGVETTWTLYDLADRLRTRGWLVPAYSLPPKLDTLVIQRVLCRHGFSLETAKCLIRDIKEQIAVLEKHPVVEPMNEKESGGFKHN